MSKDKMRQLKQEIKKLQEENEFLQIGIESREDAHNYVCKQRDMAMVLTQEIAFLLLYMQSIEELIKKDYPINSNAKIIQLAINRFRAELVNGFGDNHLYNNMNKEMTK